MFSTISFVCPICKYVLDKNKSDWQCPKCHEVFSLEDGLINFLPKNLEAVKAVDKETYSHRAQFFKPEEALKLGRPEFTAPLRDKGKNSLFLELCGGAGHHALNLMKDGFLVVESDIAPGSVKRTKEFAKALKIEQNGLFAAIDAENIPFKDNTFNGVFLIASLHHLPHPNQALKEIYRVLKKDGVLLIGYEPNTWHYYLFHPLFWLFRSIIRWRSPHPISVADDVTFGFSKKKLGKLVAEAGFVIKQIRPVDFWQMFYRRGVELFNKLFGANFKERPWLKALFKMIDQIMFKVPFLDRVALNYDVEARKKI